MRDEVAKGIPVEIDWDASAWSLTEVFNAFLRWDFEQVRNSRHISTALNDDYYFEGADPLIFSTHKRMRYVIKRGKITVHMKTELHPAVWLRLFHFITENTGWRFKTMEDSYRNWRKLNNNEALAIRCQNSETKTWPSYAMDVFLLQNIDKLNLKTSYDWDKSVSASPNSEESEEAIQSEQPNNPSKTVLEKRIEKIGSAICRNVNDMLVNYEKQRIPNLSLMRANELAKLPASETRRYQYQGSALVLAQYLKNQEHSPISQRSDVPVTTAVRL
jgi:hypothetical protein